jgi:predicted Zn-dependent protease
MLSGNVPELLKNIALIANNSRQASEIVSPSILFSKLLVIGG